MRKPYKRSLLRMGSAWVSSIHDLRQLARARGGTCLREVRSDSRHRKYRWRCQKGHTWDARAHDIRRGTWCPQCSRNNFKCTIEEMRALAARRGGHCVSRLYVNAHTKLIWRCGQGHVFAATPSHVKHGRWCANCGWVRASRQRRLSMKEIRTLAASRGGICLSCEYAPSQKLRWQCLEGHTWDANVHSVKAGCWCPICGHTTGGRKRRLTMEEMRSLAKAQGGKCLSKRYDGVDSKLRWECANGHTWFAIPSSVKKGHWCPYCAGRGPLTLQDAQKVARERGGACLSRRFVGSDRKYRWRCAEGHMWTATYSNVAWGRWCPECSAGLGERICRAHFEHLFAVRFPKSRPTWLVNSDGFQMELDGYCARRHLAFEHQGLHHYRHLRGYYYSRDQFKKRKRDDQRKRLLCRRNGITLLAIPQIPDLLPVSQVQRYILTQCSRRGIRPHAPAMRSPVKLRGAYAPSAGERLRLIREIAAARGGRCLSRVYLGSTEKLRFCCSAGHEWETIPFVILKGHWCPICAAAARGLGRRLTMANMRSLAGSRGGRSLSRQYVNAHTHLVWQCSKGHQWKAIPNSVKRGSWCPLCANERKGRHRRPEGLHSKGN